MKNDLSPKWEPATIDVNVLCNGNLDRRIKISIFDHESDGKHEKMGSFETSGRLSHLGGAFDHESCLHSHMISAIL